MNEPIIQYPCEWSFRVIGVDELALRRAASECLGTLAYQIAMSNQSSGKKYLSMNITLNVETQAMRDEIFSALKKHAAVKFLL